MVVTSTGGIAGVINISEIVRGSFQSAYLGYYAFEPLCGMGFMRRGLQLVIAHCFGESRLHRLEANIQPENLRSITLVKSLGGLCAAAAERDDLAANAGRRRLRCPRSVGSRREGMSAVGWPSRAVPFHRSGGLGVGRELCRLLIVHAVDVIGARAVTLAVYRDNVAALGLYRSLGFVSVDSRSTEESLLMRLDLANLAQPQAH